MLNSQIEISPKPLQTVKIYKHYLERLLEKPVDVVSAGKLIHSTDKVLPSVQT